MITKYFNIHNLVRIKVQSNINPKLNTILAHLREFEEAPISDDDIDIFIFDYSDCPNLKNPVSISNYYYYSNNYLNVPDKRFCFNFLDEPLFVYCDNFAVPLNLMVELKLLRKGYSLIHSAAVQYNGRNYLFPSFGGVGKTTTVSALMYNGGKLFGDDMVILNEREILSYPLDFSIYSYHLDILRIKDKKIELELRKAKELNNLVNHLKRYNSRFIKLIILMINSFKKEYVNLPPKRIFGENCIVEKGQIDEIYYLYRMKDENSNITIEEIDPNSLAKLCSNILFQEWCESMQLLYTYSGLSAFSLNLFFSKIEDVFRNAFMRHKCYKLKIPNNLDSLTYQRQLISYLNSINN